MLPLTLLACALVSDDDMDDRMDLDNDGVARPDDCDDKDPTLTVEGDFFIDADGDGYGGTASRPACALVDGLSKVGGDCDDSIATAYPGAVEVCDGVDQDCDGAADNGVEPSLWYFDGDGDGYGTPATTNAGCTAAAGYVASDADCDDADPSVHPDTLWYPDADGDGYGDTSNPSAACLQPVGLLRDGSDCNDSDAAVNPAGQEVCDTGCTGAGCDEDCDALVDNNDPGALADGFQTFYADSDGDSYGDASTSTAACDPPTGYVADGRDCDDSTPESGIECAWIKVSAGYYDSCAIRGSGLVECWGNDEEGLVSSTPGGAFIDISVSQRTEYACGIRVDGTLECWGAAIAEPPAGAYTAVSMGAYFSCALGTDGSIACWGQGDGLLLTPPSGTFVAVTAQAYAGVALAADGTAMDWGGGNGAPTTLSGSDYVLIDAGYAGVCGLDPGGSVDCVGEVDGSGVPSGPFSGPFASVSVGNNVVCMLDIAGNLTCETTGGSYFPRGGNWLALDLAYWGWCGILTTGKLSCDGANNGYGDARTDPPI